jgi:hypothetical protein
MGRPFQTPFAKPPGQGLSSSTVNVCWGLFNALIGYLLVFSVGNFDLKSTLDVAVSGLGALSISPFSARHFGHFYGGTCRRAPLGDCGRRGGMGARAGWSGDRWPEKQIPRRG